MQRNNIFIIAHRGYSSKYPECTELAFEKALETDVDFLEIDIRETKDRKIVIFHDDDLSPKTSIKGNVGDYSFDELSKVSIEAGFGNKYGFQPIILVDTVLNKIKGNTVRLCVELKDVSRKYIDGYEDFVVSKFREYNFIDRLVFNVRNLEFIKVCREKYPQIPIALEFMPDSYDSSGIDSYINIIVSLGIQIVEYDFQKMRKDVAYKLKAKGIAIWPWTINTESQLIKALDMGADAILTDDPWLIKKLLSVN